MLAAVVSLALVGAVLAPVLRTPDADSFPLSTYPMFASRRPAQQTFVYAIGATATGARRVLDTAHVGTGEVLQAIQVFERTYAGGARELTALCNSIAARVAVDADLADIITIRIVTGTHDAVEYLARGQVGQERDVVRCPVPRSTP